MDLFPTQCFLQMDSWELMVHSGHRFVSFYGVFFVPKVLLCIFSCILFPSFWNSSNFNNQSGQTNVNVKFHQKRVVFKLIRF